MQTKVCLSSVTWAGHVLNNTRWQLDERIRFVGAFLVAAALMLAPKAGAISLLSNGDFEAGWSAWTAESPVGWNTYVEDQTPNHSGTKVFKTFGCWCGDPNFSRAYQDNAASAGNTYNASGWIYSDDDDATSNFGWIQVEFLDASNTKLEVYQSARFSNADPLDTWVYFDVTNKMDITGTTNIGTVSSLVAPAGTAKVRCSAVHMQVAYAGGAIHYDDLVLNQTSGNEPPVIANLSPDGLSLFYPATSGIAFNATSATTNISPSGIQVVLNGLDISGLLTIGGTANNRSVSYTNLKSNRLYTASITVTDDAGLVESTSFNFDTFVSGNFSWEAEDYDFSSGQYINSPVLSTNDPNSYYGTAGTSEVDWHESASPDGGHEYRLDLGPGTEHCGDIARPQFAAAGGATNGVYDWDVGWTYNGLTGDWQNYTRNFPSNSYNIYGRLSGGGGTSKVRISRVTSGWGTSSQTTNEIGTFTYPSRAWQSYDWVPLTDTSGNLVAVTLSGTNTLRVSGDNANQNFFMVAPARDDLPLITGLYPTGTKPFEPGSTLSFNAASTVATIPTGNIQVTLNGNNVTPLLVIGSNPTNRSVSLAVLASNATYTATIVVTDSAGTTVSRTINFDTFSESNFSFEGEDYNFDNGQYINNPVLSTTPGPNNYYQQILAAVLDVDISTNPPAGGYGFAYGRPDAVGTEATGDYLRQAYVTAQGSDPGVTDYNIGWDNNGTWFNYTRTFPAGSHWVYARLAGPGTLNATMQTVTGATTSSQVATELGTLSGSSVGWQSYVWVPLAGLNGGMATFTPGGTATLRFTTGGNINHNYFMLVPAKTIVSLGISMSGGNPVISIPTQAGAGYTIQYKSSLTTGSWTYLTMVLGDGTTKTVTDTTAAGNQRYYRAIIQ